MKERVINTLIKDIHRSNVEAGWWDGKPCVYEKFQLVSTEVAEATEGVRKDLMDDHLPHRKMEEVELADALIRTLDLCGRLDIEYMNPDDYLPAVNPEYSTGRLHLSINFHIINAVEQYSRFEITEDELTRQLDSEHVPLMDAKLLKTAHEQHVTRLTAGMSELIVNILAVATHRGHDIHNALLEKFAYNKKRADHTREARAAEHGKKF